MLASTPRLIGALFTAAALMLPAAAGAQATGASPAPPTTAPTKDAGKKPQEPPSTVEAAKASSAPTPQKGSTAVPGWNNPPSWSSASERPQYASIPGVRSTSLFVGNISVGGSFNLSWAAFEMAASMYAYAASTFAAPLVRWMFTGAAGEPVSGWTNSALRPRLFSLATLPVLAMNTAISPCW